jgi:hypothetical protein
MAPAHRLVKMGFIERLPAFFSLIETAKANGHEPYAYLQHIFKRLPLVTTGEEYEALLPWNVDPGSLAVESDSSL